MNPELRPPLDTKNGGSPLKAGFTNRSMRLSLIDAKEMNVPIKLSKPSITIHHKNTYKVREYQSPSSRKLWPDIRRGNFRLKCIHTVWQRSTDCLSPNSFRLEWDCERNELFHVRLHALEDSNGLCKHLALYCKIDVIQQCQSEKLPNVTGREVSQQRPFVPNGVEPCECWRRKRGWFLSALPKKERQPYLPGWQSFELWQPLRHPNCKFRVRYERVVAKKETFEKKTLWVWQIKIKYHLVINWVPLISAMPSFGRRQIGWRPCVCKTRLACAQPVLALHILPSPMNPSARWARGARSPEAPTVPCSGTHGMQSELKASKSWCMAFGEIPEWPLASTLILKANNLRTRSMVKGRPTPDEWLRIKFLCNCSNSDRSIMVLANLPKPVLIP